MNGMTRPAAKDRVKAGKYVVMLDLGSLNAEIANGHTKRGCGHDLPDRRRALDYYYCSDPGFDRIGCFVLV
jgi:hypothetical protein